MNKTTGNKISGLLGILFLLIFIFPARGEEQIYLFPDRSSAVSGDTIWFGINIFSKEQGEMSNVVHVQLDDLENNHISKVSVLCDKGTGEGYIPVPDSLSTGVYVLRAFSFIQNSNADSKLNQRFVKVYNRFEEELFEIDFPLAESRVKYEYNNALHIETEKESYKKGEEVVAGLDIPQEVLNNTSQVIITAGLEEASNLDFATSWYPVAHKSAVKLPVPVVEKNGVLISGKVHSAEDNHPVPNAVVILSIPDSIPFLDYCVSDSSGIFYFYLRNAFGTADIVLQALAKNSMPCTIELYENFIDVDRPNVSRKMFNREELIFGESVIKASYFTKLFRGYKIESGSSFVMPRQFEHPFYGEPTKTFYPELFVDLPDFQEISREILHGVQYRERKTGTTIRLLNLGGDAVFKEEPLKLLDGIPVFDPEVFAPMGTDDIARVDVVYEKKFFGDLSFSGILSIYTKNRSLSWVDVNPSTGHFEYPCLQLQKKWSFKNQVVSNTHIPNFCKVLYRNIFDTLNGTEEFGFATSDLKGDIVIRVVLVQKDHEVLYSEKIIKVE
ncbi:hypothetical protein GM418_16345 [Maribellus comscasis]|uniref:Macroglobulin domain-containing protein n=1 Tax=Maribellus comscasis TaxID=2681766 RepID=A0A6I6JQD2_9BACT|nr:hypothetical protein [Maribellus comscasis]QGY45185.1 hypothetical protein GM418_16345 [Maribellus comscasis]